jgi:spore coat polysaccharide biosynthesis protein SpsF (cytidylyltransferase family)
LGIEKETPSQPFRQLAEKEIGKDIEIIDMQTLLKLKIEHLEEGQEAYYTAKILLPARTPVP